MYSSAGYRDWEIGDIDVFIDEDGIHHLFHLIIPNHDYIAHAVSKDGFNWTRTKNALFVGDPGDWDDDMLWTMHVSRDSENDRYIMYYTGLKLSDRGVVQKIGRAVSHDLTHWEKIDGPGFPLESDAPNYEDLHNNPRGWLSFRDPFSFRHEGEHYLLICARSSSGPVSRRGCVGMAKESAGKFELQRPLHIPYVYDDVECPCIVCINDRFYLIGSIREDVKVRYWFAPDFKGEYHSFHANVLLPEGNYAARVIKDDGHYLVNNFYFMDGNIDLHRVLPPPKELDVDKQGRLVLKSYYRWKEHYGHQWMQDEFPHPSPVLANPTASFIVLEDGSWQMQSRSGYEFFLCTKPGKSFLWEGRLLLEDLGKTGFLLECDEEGSGYHISMDFVNGFLQFRRWGFDPSDNQHNFIFDNLQTNQFELDDDRAVDFRLICFGNYYELSINGIVKLTLLDDIYKEGKFGIYTSSAAVRLSHSVFYELIGEESEYARAAEHGG